LTIFANSTDLPEGSQYPLILCQRVLISLLNIFQRVLDNLYKPLQDGYPVNKERSKLFAIPMTKLKVKIKIQEVTV
jgi:hypothetical protein